MWVLVSGLAFTAAGGLGVYQSWRLNRTGARVSGTVVDFRWKPGGRGGGQICHPVVEFRTAGGQIVRTETGVGGSATPGVGTRVPLVHDPERPTHVNIDTWSGRATWIPVVALVIGLGLIARVVCTGQA